MKILTKEEEAAHYRATLEGGFLGCAGGLAVGIVGIMAASRRYHFVRHLTLPMKAFLVTSSSTFAGIIAADSASRRYEQQRNPLDRQFLEREKELKEAERANMTFTQKAMEFGRKERYKIVGGSWVASMAAAFAIVNRNKYLTGAQKLVQARVYAQFLTLGVLIASAAFEISDSRNQQGRYETVKYIDPSDPEHKRMLEKREFIANGNEGSESDNMWKEMVAAEEQRIKEREEDEARYRKRQAKKQQQQKKEGEEAPAKKEK